MNKREVILAILLVITLAAGIAMALCISLIMRPMSIKARTKYISATGLNLMEMNKRCNCGIMGLDYKFVSKKAVLAPAAPGQTKSELRLDNERSRAMDDRSTQQLRTSIGTDTFYDELDYVRSMGVDDDEIVSRILSMNDSDSDTIADTMDDDTISTTGKGGVAISDKLLNSIWELINTKKLNITTDNEKQVIKRSYPNEAPHCFVPLPKKNSILEKSPSGNYSLWRYHPNLISISGPKYFDDAEDLQYLCSGIIIHRDYAITGKHCIQEKLIKLLKIRSSSRYWCKEGLQHRILDVFFSASLALIKIHPGFKLREDALRKLKIGVEMALVNVVGSSAGWIKDDARRFSKYSIATWGINCHDCRKIVIDNGSCLDSFGHPLIDDGGVLIGIRSCGDAFIKISEIRPLLVKFQPMFR